MEKGAIQSKENKNEKAEEKLIWDPQKPGTEHLGSHEIGRERGGVPEAWSEGPRQMSLKGEKRYKGEGSWWGEKSPTSEKPPERSSITGPLMHHINKLETRS